jgi:hypothetical protein
MGELLRSLTTLPDSLPNLPGMLFHLLLAFVLAQPLAFVYVRTHQGTSYSRSFVQSLVLLPLIVTIVMLAVGDSLARAFGLFGALALIRFRTPIKDSRDTVFLFLAMAVGITVGVQQVLLSIVGTGLVLLFAIYLYGTRFGERIQHDGVLRCTLPTGGEAPSDLLQLLKHYCRRFDLISVQAAATGTTDFTYQLRLREADAHADLVADLQSIPGATDVSVLVQNEHEEV